MKDFLEGMLGLLILIAIIIGTIFIFIKIFDSKPQTPEEQYRNLYSNCVESQYIGGRDINNCNNIQPPK